MNGEKQFEKRIEIADQKFQEIVEIATKHRDQTSSLVRKLNKLSEDAEKPYQEFEEFRKKHPGKGNEWEGHDSLKKKHDKIFKLMDEIKLRNKKEDELWEELDKLKINLINLKHGN